MTQHKTGKKREQWGSKLGFILAAAGSAIGLGNIWKFPYVAGDSGGAAFIVVFLVCIFIIGLPVTVGEILIGRTAQRGPVGAFKKLGNNSRLWTSVGALGVVTGFLILSFYAVVAGWSLGYVVESLKGTFFTFEAPEAAGMYFQSLTSNPYWIIGFLFIFMAISLVFVLFGIQKGIERGSKIMMPVLFILLLALMVRGLTLKGASKGLEFFFSPDWSKINGQVILLALGQAFFTMSIGMGAMLTYGSYMSEKDNILSSSLQILILDTAISIIAGVAIFTAVFANGQDPAEGPGLIFHIIPVVFSSMPGGYFFSILFFILLTIAAITSAISLLEVITSYLVDEKQWNRKKAVVLCSVITFFLAIPSALSYTPIFNDKLIGDKNFFDIIDFVSSNIFLPLGGLLTAIFVAWFWGFDKALLEMKKGAEDIFENHFYLIKLWKIFLRYFAPVLILVVLLHSMGILSLLGLEF
ncbi:MAG: sodium-dependent transporter [Bacteroidia bacterium]|nr:MAG: sodium-dependent transporter [Bacteroidia bacterium]